MAAEKFDPYQTITDQVIALLEQGTAPWRKPWNAEAGMPRSLSTGKVYRGINPFLLGMSAMAAGYTSPFWGTYKAITDHGGQVRKGEKGTLIIFWKQFLTKELDAKGNPKRAFVLRTYKVFNTDQADGLNITVTAPTGADNDPITACEDAAARYINNGGPDVTHGADAAFYIPARDVLRMPNLSTFDGAPEYYSTLFHELTHSTGHKDRLNREGFHSFGHFGDNNYSKEELVAECGAAMVCGITGILPATIDNSAAYLASWLKVLKADNRLIVSAAAQAQKAADLILGVTYDSGSDQGSDQGATGAARASELAVAAS